MVMIVDGQSQLPVKPHVSIILVSMMHYDLMNTYFSIFLFHLYESHVTAVHHAIHAIMQNAYSSIRDYLLHCYLYNIYCRDIDTALLMSEKSQAVYYISSCHIMLIDKALPSDKPNGHWFEADWLHCKRDALFSNRNVDGSRLTGSTQSWYS